MKLLSSSVSETRKIAALLAEEIKKTRNWPAHAFVVGLKGNLGAGKTVFVQGLARGLGIKRKITSPTFLIIRNYKLRNGNYGKLYHVDAYRLKRAGELSALGFKEMIGNPKNIIVIEWADKMKQLLPQTQKTTWVELKPGKGENERVINFSNRKKQ